MEKRTINLPERLDNAVQKESEKRGISKSELYRSALRNYLEV